MSFWDQQQLAKATGGQWHGELKWAGARIITDTRQIAENDIFLAICGERFDAHDFVLEAQQRGACAVIVERDVTVSELTVPQLHVASSRRALGDLARHYRQQFPALRVAALTGSSGKTTTKEMLGAILARMGETLMTRGNLNNDLGVPMMVLELGGQHQFAVFELGASHVGEIDYTAHMVAPQVVGVLNIGTAHVGEFGGRDGITRAKSEIFSAPNEQGIAVIPTQDDYAVELASASTRLKQIRFGEGGDIFARDVVLGAQHSQFVLHTPQGSIPVQLNFVGSHNVVNALAAAAMAYALDMDLATIAAGLAAAESAKGRLNFKVASFGLLIDDTYNANPHSMIAAAKVLAIQSGYRMMVVGDMAELGDASAAEHAALGQQLARQDIQQLYAVGSYAQQYASGAKSAEKVIHTFESKTVLLERLQEDIRQAVAHYGTVAILLKGSRTAAMETLIPALMEMALC